MSMDTLPHRLIFIRHGETNWNAQGRLQGQHDIPLNGRGRDQAANAGREARKYIAREGLTDLRFVASPLSRTRDTMEIARGSMGLDPKAYSIRTAPALLKKTKAWADYCDAEHPLAPAIKKLAAKR